MWTFHRLIALTTSRATGVVQVRRFGEPDGLDVVEVPMPTARKGEVRVRVLVSSLNYTDTLIRRHTYPQTAGRASAVRTRL
jgi:NADPH:quinone reductase-like Zn-dependent oxidoreductase